MRGPLGHVNLKNRYILKRLEQVKKYIPPDGMNNELGTIEENISKFEIDNDRNYPK